MRKAICPNCKMLVQYDLDYRLSDIYLNEPVPQLKDLKVYQYHAYCPNCKTELRVPDVEEINSDLRIDAIIRNSNK